ncbi:MAG: AAA family ATPase, partial [Actinobacteria bacterium]|nr:AAA family ATPase [Actinomycetota bacterium]
MYLRRIELQGFKTFSRRTTLDLPRGITAVVGPNGSGKSNLTDAIRWALGEQGLRALRIKKSEDVIFSGSEARARTGMAEVVLTFDNEDGWLPTPFREVVVGRRLFRSGETEYTLNGARVRLRDVVDLMSAGATGHGHSMIRQGEIDALLQQRPEDRRAFLEEAAGVARFYTRRDQAQQRLAITRRNLERLRDLVAEIEPRLETLRQQAEVATRGKELADELRAAQQTVLRHRLFQVVRQLETAETREQAAAQAVDAVMAEPVERMRQQARDAEQQMAELDIEVNGARAHLARLAATAQRLATERTVRAERRANLTSRLDETRGRAAA